MEKLKLAIIYYSMSGTNHQMALWAKETAAELGCEVKLLKAMELAPQAAIDRNPVWKALHENNVPIATPDDLVESDAIIFSSPTRYGNVCSQMKQFLDSTGSVWAKGLLNNKVVTAMTSANNAHGGQEQTLLQLYTSMYHWGAIIVTPGFMSDAVYAAGGNPYGTSATVSDSGMVDAAKVKEAVFFQTKRLVAVAKRLKGK